MSKKLIVERDVETPMRDGVVLRADVYRLDSVDPLPVLLQRTPYRKGFSQNSFALMAAERGYARNVQDGIQRAKYRVSGESSLLTPGEVYEFTISLGATSNVFKAGHRLRLEISSSNFPRFDRNTNTGQPPGTDVTLRPAYQTIFHDREHPSHIILPTIPR